MNRHQSSVAEPLSTHLAAGEAQDRRRLAVNRVMLREGLSWPDAEKIVDGVGVEAILAEDSAPSDPTPKPPVRFGNGHLEERLADLEKRVAALETPAPKPAPLQSSDTSE